MYAAKACGHTSMLSSPHALLTVITIMQFLIIISFKVGTRPEIIHIQKYVFLSPVGVFHWFLLSFKMILLSSMGVIFVDSKR
jgi:hypothetical protein